MQISMYFLYNLLYILALSFIFPLHLLKRPPHLRGRWLKERFGFVPMRIIDPSWQGERYNHRPTIWIHVVSVGESISARPLIKRLMEQANVIVSTVTDTGQKIVRDFITERERCIYLPFDTPFAVKRVVSRMRPDLLVIMEAELWPNLLRIVKGFGTPVLIVNGRISNRSFFGYQKIRFFMKYLLMMVDYYCMQTDGDAERIIALGAPEKRVCVTGNLKFDSIPTEEEIPLWCKDLSRPIIIAGSTHKGEEEIILNTFYTIKKDFKEATLIIAPRHPERFREVEDGLLKRRKLEFGKRSNGSYKDKEIILLDTIGELFSVYGCADLCIIGGSLVPKGGHNLFEPAYWAKPIVCGPHMENFPLASDFFRNNAAVMVRRDNIDKVLIKILSDKSTAEEMGRGARELYIKNRGATSKTLEVVNRFV
ncbi:MAG: 3-deoxy-D-manno-octulosonic acid transferase [Nitrospinae bacterium]|nr:3-deoxy-D-manno-octulosonic acid transferase [Nitrospinota bacterium]